MTKKFHLYKKKEGKSQKLSETKKRHLKANIRAGDDHVVVLYDQVGAEPPLRVPLHVTVGVAASSIISHH